MNLFAFGASTTYGAWDTEGGWVTRLRKRIDHQGFEHFIYNLGISGDTTEDILVRFDHEIQSRYDEGDEHIVLFAIGINDAVVWYPEVNRFWVEPEKFEENLQTLFSKANQFTQKIAFISLFPVEEHKVNPSPWDPEAAYKMKNIEKYNEILRKVTNELQMPLVDLYTVFANESLAEVLHDGLHPNDTGHEIIAREVFNFLQTSKWIA